jgi:hypothetical protein
VKSYILRNDPEHYANGGLRVTCWIFYLELDIVLTVVRKL